MTGLTVHIPTLETERLILRAPVRADFAAYERFIFTPRSNVKEPSRRTAWNFFAGDIVSWCLDGVGHWVIETRDGTVVGVTGFSQPAHYSEPEMGWSLYDGFEGHGFATEAAKAARNWARERVGALVSYIAPGNAKSVAVATRLGAHLDNEAVLPEGNTPDTCLVYRHWGPQA